MAGHDHDRIFKEAMALPEYAAVTSEVADAFGPVVRAIEMSNAEYAARHRKMANSNNMKAPPRHQRIFGGFLVVRQLNTQRQYETWMPLDAFQECYRRAN